MLTRKGILIVGNWKHDQLDGRAIIFTPFGGKIYINFNEGKVNGWVFAIFSEKIIICMFYYENQIDGEKITYEESQQLWVASKYSADGKFISISHVEKGSRKYLPTFINS